MLCINNFYDCIPVWFCFSVEVRVHYFDELPGESGFGEVTMGIIIMGVISWKPLKFLAFEELTVQYNYYGHYFLEWILY